MRPFDETFRQKSRALRSSAPNNPTFHEAREVLHCLVQRILSRNGVFLWPYCQHSANSADRQRCHHRIRVVRTAPYTIQRPWGRPLTTSPAAPATSTSLCRSRCWCTLGHGDGSCSSPEWRLLMQFQAAVVQVGGSVARAVPSRGHGRQRTVADRATRTITRRSGDKDDHAAVAGAHAVRQASAMMPAAGPALSWSRPC